MAFHLAESRRRGRRWPSGWRRRLITALILIPACLVWIYPLIWMVSSSLKTNGEIFASLALLPDVIQLGSYINAWVGADMGQYFLNSVIVTLGGVVIVLASTSTMGYVLARYPFPGRRIVIVFLAALVFLPQGFTIIPIVTLIDFIHLDGSLFGIILAESGSAHILQILLFVGYFRQLPNDLEEAATVDGAGFLRVFYKIYLPLAGPVIVTVIIIQFIASWNDFLIPLALTLSQPQLRTLAVGVYALQGQTSTDWATLCAASTIALMPVIIAFLFLQKYFISGITGAVKG